tara:strand:- start:1417 stop:1635 length:219 start_codon:yes stop_codon:yes gene_type:complete
MRIGLKKPHMNRLGLKKAAHTSMRLGLKASDIAMAAAPVVAFGGPEAMPVAAALEAGGAIGKKVFGLGSKIV